MAKNKQPHLSVKKHINKHKEYAKAKKLKKLKPKLKQSKKNYSVMSVDDFIEKDVPTESAEENESELSENELLSDDENITDALVTKDENESELSEVDEIDEFKSHKQSLQKLKDTDPEFYKFLSENDRKLLDFNVSDSEDEERQKEDKIHKPNEDLEIASDEDDFEPEESKPSDGRNITLKLLKTWQSNIQTDKSSATISCLMKAFHAALVRVSNDNDNIDVEFRIDGSSVFNGVIQLCVLELGPALKRFLKIQQGSKLPPHKCKKFIKIRAPLRGYFLDLLKLLGGITSPNILNVLLKHLHYLSPFLVSYTNVTKKLLKRIINLWGTSEESVRIIGFLCILRIANTQPTSYLDYVLKTMYMTYVKNSKFMSLNSLAEINFMRRSLTEMFALDINVSYQHVFLYIRQLAIHLRTAVTVHKKENIQIVCNWQFINSLHLWANLLAVTCNRPQLQPLIYPLVQIIIGTIKLVPTAQFFPLRFHCLQILTDLSRDTNIFIPVLPLLLEVLNLYDFNKKHKKVSMKPLHFTCILRLSKSHMIENGFKDTTIESFYGRLLDYLSNLSHTISFPDTALFCILQLKQFLKKCNVVNYTKKIKHLLEKIEQNIQFIETERKKISFNITDFKRIEAWESTIKSKGTPMTAYHEIWKKQHNMKKNKELTNNESIAEYKLPEIKKILKKRETKKDGPVELFPSDSEEDEELMEAEEVEEKKKPRLKRGSKKHKKSIKPTSIDKDLQGGPNDIVQDLKASDW